ncbi:hypothetical protein DQ237_19115 [Blastococcus sp. TF02-8]|uniref:hypothetical protein n=1 Tax=Blastococcus sp. TF02-8 TaxID=2250574 RepID=UPI000DEB21FC|nr:hypothetical protein [Blastococcus sp. TF02-8]RBY91928.1 hypothetical protein DQ237_19115 [Blastococcus sp. TF02-8]
MPTYRLVALERTQSVVFDAVDDDAAEQQARETSCRLPEPPQGCFATFLLEREIDRRWSTVRAWVPERGVLPLRGYGT